MKRGLRRACIYLYSSGWFANSSPSPIVFSGTLSLAWPAFRNGIFMLFSWGLIYVKIVNDIYEYTKNWPIDLLNWITIVKWSKPTGKGSHLSPGRSSSVWTALETEKSWEGEAWLWVGPRYERKITVFLRPRYKSAVESSPVQELRSILLLIQAPGSSTQSGFTR